MSKVHRRVTYRLYPSAKQDAALWAMHECHRNLYNAALQERQDAWRLQKVSIGFSAQCKSLTQIRADDPTYRAINAQSGQVTLKRLDLAFSAFFRRVRQGEEPGYPRFKSKARFSGWAYKAHGDGFRFIPGKNWRHGKLHLSGIGTMGARGEARTPGDIVRCDIKRDATGWLLSLVVSCVPQRERTDNKQAGLDWGVGTLGTLAYGVGNYDEIPNDRLFAAQRECAGAKARAASKRLRGRRSNRAKKRRRAVAVQYRRLANRRKDRAHKVSARLVATHALIVTEKLDMANLTRSSKGSAESFGKNVAQKAGLNREILDTTPGTLMNMLRVKAEEAACEIMFVDPRVHKPSQTCPGCGVRKKKTLRERHHDCSCGFRAGRDQAAALVLLQLGLSAKGQEAGLGGNPETPSRAA